MVAAVLAVLFLMIGYVFRFSVGVSHNIGCVNNLRILALTNLRYAEEHHGTLASGASADSGSSRPRNMWWRYNLRTYLGAANGDGTSSGDQGFCPELLCPADDTRGGEDASGNVSESLRRSYNVNAKLERRVQGVRIRYRLQEIHEPALLTLCGEGDFGYPSTVELENGELLSLGYEQGVLQQVRWRLRKA